MISLVTMLPLLCLVFYSVTSFYKLSCNCPITLYAEQLNPEILTIHRFLQKTIKIPLANSKIKHRPVMKYYKSVTLTDSENNSVTLHALTPEEHHRFMAYWKAANRPKES